MLCVYMSVVWICNFCVYAAVHVVGTCMGMRTTSVRCLPLFLCMLILEQFPNDQELSNSARLAHLKVLGISLPLSIYCENDRCMLMCKAFYVSASDQNSGVFACMTSTLFPRSHLSSFQYSILSLEPILIKLFSGF